MFTLCRMWSQLGGYTFVQPYLEPILSYSHAIGSDPGWLAHIRRETDGFEGVGVKLSTTDLAIQCLGIAHSHLRITTIPTGYGQSRPPRQEH